MIYANDQWIQLPVKDLYDSQIMLASIQAARDLYKDRRDDLKDFYSKYGDFVTPIAADQEYWANNIVGPTTNVINDMYKQDIDPLRSQEGAMILSQLRNKINNADVARLKTRANNAIDWYKAMSQLRQKGMYNEDFSKFLGETPDQWAPDSMGYASPTAFQTLKDATADWYDNRSLRNITKDEIKRLGLDPRYSYTGFLDSDLMNIARDQTPGWQGTPLADYYRELAKRQVEARGEKATQEKIEAQLQRNIASAQQEWLASPKQGDADPFILDDYKTANEIKAHRKKAEIDYEYKHKDDAADGNGDTEQGYDLQRDVYVTSLMIGADKPYMPKSGVTFNMLPQLLGDATKKQIKRINETKNVLTATGMFISPQKVSGLIQKTGEDKDGYFLDPSFIQNLHDLNEIRSSYKGWVNPSLTNAESKEEREKRKGVSSEIQNQLRNSLNSSESRRVKVVLLPDENGNNVYGMVGDDNRWHTYARVRVYVSKGDGKTGKTNDVPSSGKDMVLEVGLRSNENKATPDLSVKGREKLSLYGYDATKSEIGMTGNSAFPYSSNVISQDEGINIPYRPQE